MQLVGDTDCVTQASSLSRRAGILPAGEAPHGAPVQLGRLPDRSGWKPELRRFASLSTAWIRLRGAEAERWTERSRRTLRFFGPPGSFDSAPKAALRSGGRSFLSFGPPSGGQRLSRERGSNSLPEYCHAPALRLSQTALSFRTLMFLPSPSSFRVSSASAPFPSSRRPLAGRPQISLPFCHRL